MTSGINIGSYSSYGNAYVRFICKVKDNSLAAGLNQLVNWANVTVEDEVYKDDASVLVEKNSETPILPDVNNTQQVINQDYDWGPERETFTMESPATYPAFNSILNNPTIGDERDFVRIGEITPERTELSDSVELSVGKRYLVYIYYHNNASATYNLEKYSNAGVSLNTRLATFFPTSVDNEHPGVVSATITSDNAIPSSVWDAARMVVSSDEKVYLHYEEGSARIYNDGKTNGESLPTDLFLHKGALLGYDELNGMVPGCEQYHGVVSYVIQALGE